jgi:hypothetical protein
MFVKALETAGKGRRRVSTPLTLRQRGHRSPRFHGTRGDLRGPDSNQSPHEAPRVHQGSGRTPGCDAPATRESRPRAGFRAAKWREADSNRRHHDFQGVAVRRTSSRKTCKAPCSHSCDSGTMPWVSRGYARVWDSAGASKSQWAETTREAVMQWSEASCGAKPLKIAPTIASPRHASYRAG